MVKEQEAYVPPVQAAASPEPVQDGTPVSQIEPTPLQAEQPSPAAPATGLLVAGLSADHVLLGSLAALLGAGMPFLYMRRSAMFRMSRKTEAVQLGGQGTVDELELISREVRRRSWDQARPAAYL